MIIVVFFAFNHKTAKNIRKITVNSRNQSRKSGFLYLRFFCCWLHLSSQDADSVTESKVLPEIPTTGDTSPIFRLTLNNEVTFRKWIQPRKWERKKVINLHTKLPFISMSFARSFGVRRNYHQKISISEKKCETIVTLLNVKLGLGDVLEGLLGEDWCVATLARRFLGEF